MKSLTRAIVAGLSCAGLLALAPMSLADDKDSERARRAMEAGEIKPLRDILNEVERVHGGRLIEAELESEHGRMIYELKLLTAEGRVLKLIYDARTGRPLSGNERDGRR